MIQNNVERSLGRLEGKVDSLISDIKVIRRGAEHKLKELDTRVHKLEKKQYTIVIIASLTFTILISYLKKFF